AQRRAEFLEALARGRGVRILLEPVRMTIETGNAPARGASDAPVTIVEFSDYQCPYCASMVPTLKKLKERYAGKVRLVFRDFQFHKDAPKAAEAAACAGEQGRFWEMSEKLFANPTRLQAADLRRYASELGLEAASFNPCLDSGRMAPQVQRSKD